MSLPKHTLTQSEVSRVVEMAWEDRTPFEVIEAPCIQSLTLAFQ